MSGLHLWFSLLIVLLFSSAGLFSLLFNQQPETQSALHSVLLLIGLTLATLTTLIHLLLRRRAALRTSLERGVRRGLFLGLLVVVLLYLNATNLLTLWNGIPLIIALGLIEGFFSLRPLARLGS